MFDKLKMRIHGDSSLPTLIYLPGMHGDWTLVSSFRAAMTGRVRFVEFTYPRTTNWPLDDYGRAIEEQLLANGIGHGWLLGESFGSQPAWQIVKRFLERSGEGNESNSAGNLSTNCPLSASLSPAGSGGEGGRRPGEGERSWSQCKREGGRRLSVNRSPSPPPQLPFTRGTVQPAPLPSRERAEAGSFGNNRAAGPVFQPLGLVLAGGFVRHPVIWAVRLAKRVSGAIPLRLVKLLCVGYARYARFRHRRAPETYASIGEFVANRTVEADRNAIVHRYTLIADNDLRPVARAARLPVYYLAGLVDPLVPWYYVRWWLRRNCPAYCGGKTVWRADHNVLGTAPRASAELIFQWMNRVTGAGMEVPALTRSLAR